MEALGTAPVCKRAADDRQETKPCKYAQVIAKSVVWVFCVCICPPLNPNRFRMLVMIHVEVGVTYRERLRRKQTSRTPEGR